MAHITDYLHNEVTFPSSTGWTNRFKTWLRTRSENRDRMRVVRGLLVYNDHLLSDMGLAREELVEELGYDPDALPELYHLGTNRMPYL